MILKVAGKDRNEEEVYAQLQKLGDGPACVINLAEQEGLPSLEMASAALEDLINLQTRSFTIIVALWSESESRTWHYGVITEANEKEFHLADPAVGPDQKLDDETFREKWTGWLMATLLPQ